MGDICLWETAVASGKIREKALHSFYSQATCFKASGQRSSHPPARPAGSALCFRAYCFVDVTHRDWHKLRCLQDYSTPTHSIPMSSPRNPRTYKTVFGSENSGNQRSREGG
ncbi:hypothetical protein J6590_086373 [Homalodisca vitripennis]|nr:hypothetical protein J6590_086373 [Homalodisca vitripennis]